jgi:hypothetical protein
MVIEKTLWFTIGQPRSYFLVPRDLALPAGSLSVRSLLGEEQAVDAAGLINKLFYNPVNQHL